MITAYTKVLKILPSFWVQKKQTNKKTKQKKKKKKKKKKNCESYATITNEYPYKTLCMIC